MTALTRERRAAMSAGALGGAVGGAAYTLLDGLTLVAGAPPNLAGVALVKALLLALGVGWAVGAPLGAGLGLLQARRLGRRGAAVLAVVAAGAWAVDAHVLVGLYAAAHLWLGALGAGLAVLAGAAAAPSDRGASMLVWLGPTVAPWALPALVGEGDAQRAALVGGTTVVGRVVAWTVDPPAAPPGGDTACAWPAAAVPPHTGAYAGATVVLISIDAWRADQPLAQALPLTAARLPPAVTFTQAVAPANRTTESMYAALTGRYPHHLQLVPALLSPEDAPLVAPREPSALDPRTWAAYTLAPVHDTTPTVIAAAQAAGYARYTAVAYRYLKADLGLTRDFDTVDDGPYQAGNRDREGVSSAALTDAALRWLPTAPDKALIWLHYLDPHEPYHPFGDVPASASDRARHGAELARVDAALARLMDGVHATGRRVLWVITADHGEAFGERGDRFHGSSVFDEQVHVPLHIAVPGGGAATVTTPVSLVDLAPTLADALGWSMPAPVDGRSLLPALQGEPLAPRPVLTRSSRDGFVFGVVDGPWKLVVDLRHQTRALFHRGEDPGERTSRVDAEPAVRDRLQCLLDATGAVR